MTIEPLHLKWQSMLFAAAVVGRCMHALHPTTPASSSCSPKSIKGAKLACAGEELKALSGAWPRPPAQRTIEQEDDAFKEPFQEMEGGQ